MANYLDQNVSGKLIFSDEHDERLANFVTKLVTILLFRNKLLAREILINYFYKLIMKKEKSPLFLRFINSMLTMRKKLLI